MTVVPEIVLFCTEHEATTGMREAFASTVWPRGFRVSMLEVREDPEAGRWLPLADRPVVAVMFDGAVLALEHECSAAACRRLLRVAEAQLRHFEEL